MTDVVTAVLFLSSTGLFVLVGLRAAAGGRPGLDQYLTARNRFAAPTGVATLLASSFGAWLLFSPAEAATWGGTAAVLGYAVGVAAPRLAMIPLGQRLRRCMPHGCSPVDFVRIRYGAGLSLVVTAVMVLYLGVALAAEATATAKLIGAISDLPVWFAPAVSLLAVLLYTGVGGLGASIVTDRGQMFVIVPFLLLLAVAAIAALMGAAAPSAGAVDPLALMSLDGSWETAGALVLAILFTGVLAQGNWQRVYAMRDERAVTRSLAWAALAAAPVILLVGSFGLVHDALGLETPSAAVFAVVDRMVPDWMLWLVAVLGVALVLSSMDTTVMALLSLCVVVGRQLRPDWSRRVLMRLALGVTSVIALAAFATAIQGWSVLYLFLLADLFCAAIAIPVFAGTYLTGYGPRLAGVSMSAGLAVGFWQFPGPSLNDGSLFWSFALAAGVPALLVPLCLLSRRPFDFTRLSTDVQPYRD